VLVHALVLLNVISLLPAGAYLQPVSTNKSVNRHGLQARASGGKRNKQKLN
jgi:hypothetical protein